MNFKTKLSLYIITILMSIIMIVSCKGISDGGDSGDGGDGGDVGEGWIESTILDSPGQNGDQYGWSIGISKYGYTIGVGALSDTAYGEWAGAGYIYKDNGVNFEHTKILPSDGGVWSKFGSSCSISDDEETVVFGAQWDAPNDNAAGAAYIYKWYGYDWGELKIIPSDGEPFDQFGKSLALSGDGNTLVVGAWQDDDPNGDEDDDPDATPETGSAYVYKKDGANWVETKLTASNWKKNAFFGMSVDVSDDGNRIVVGSSGWSEVAGAWDGLAYVYDWNSTSSEWDETIIEPIGTAYHDDEFGKSVCISGDGNRIVVGSPEHLAQGAVYIYDYSGSAWTGEKLMASDYNVSGYFGFSVDISDDGSKIIVGAPDTYAYAGTETPGKAYLFEKDGSSWTEKQFVGTGVLDAGLFGEAVAMSGDGNTFVVGTYRMEKAYVYTKE